MPPEDGKRFVVVTGASTGIGLGTVKVLIKAGFHVFGSVRKQSDADHLQREFGDLFTPLLFNVCDASAVMKAAAQVKELLNGHTLHGLVNNAGVAFYGPLMYQPLEESRNMMETNLLGTLQVTQAFLPLLGVDADLQGLPGRIVMVSSVVGKLALPFIGSYAASKHALEGMSTSLRRELMLYGVDVIVIGPGAVATPFYDKSEAQDMTMYDSTPYKQPLAAFGKVFIGDGRSGYSPERIGRGILKALTVKHPRPRYAIVAERLVRWSLPLTLPVRLVDWILASKLKLLPKQNLSQKSNTGSDVRVD